MIDYSSEFSVWDRYANLSSACEHLGAQNWSTVITDAVNHIAAPTSAQYAIFRNDAATQRLCQIAAARVAWGTPCYAQTWHHCVQHDDDPSLNVFPPQTPRCEWNLPTNYSSSFASGCTSGRSPLHADVAASDQAALGAASCNSAHTCRVLQHPVIPAAAAGLPATDPSLVGFPTIDAVTTFDPYWDLHCRNGGVRHWTYTKDDSGHTAQMTNGNIDCVCPAGWEGAECAQCSADESCASAGYGAKATCDRTIGEVDDAPFTASCVPIGGTKILFESYTNTKSSMPNVHISRKFGTVRINVLGETDFPWNQTAYVPTAKLVKQGDGNGTGLAQNPTSFHMIGTGCISTRRAACPPLSGHPKGSTCNTLKCNAVRYVCPSDCDNDPLGPGPSTHCTPTTSRFVNCPAPRNLPKGPFNLAITEVGSVGVPSGGNLLVSFELGILGPFQISCNIGSCRRGSAPPAPQPSPPAPAPIPSAAATANPCSKVNIAAHPDRSQACLEAGYFLIFGGPLVVTLFILFGVLFAGGGLRGIGAICSKRCLDREHLGSGWSPSLHAKVVCDGTHSDDEPNRLSESGLGTALLDIADSAAMAPPQRTKPPPTLPALLPCVSPSDTGCTDESPVTVPGVHRLSDSTADETSGFAHTVRGIAFRNVVASTGGCSGDRAILRGVSGVCRAGELLAVMGPSGCGKTTLLDILSGRKNTGRTSGQIRIDGALLNSTSRRQTTSMVFQDDVLPGTSSAAEFLEFHAALRPVVTPSSGTTSDDGHQRLSRAEIVASRRKRMRRYITKMDLAKCINTPMGDELHRGLSGGERRRVSIASALMSSPSVLFLDEPTSGLDSSSAQSVIGALDIVVNDGCAAVFVIHQPPAQLFDQFDRLLLLSSDGRPLFSGPRHQVLRYFAELDAKLHTGGALVCPEDAAAPEFLMDLIMLSPPDLIDSLANEFPMSEIGRQTQLLVETAENAPRSVSLPGASSVRDARCTAASLASTLPDFCRQVYRLTLRSAVLVVRRPTVLLVHYAATIALAAALAIAFPPFDLGDEKTLNAVLERVGFFFFVLSYFFLASLSVVGIWREERMLFLRERDARCYSAPAYLTAKFITDTLLLRVVPPSLFAAVTYAAVNLRVGTAFAFTFTQLLVATNVGATAIFFAISVVSPTVSSANLLCILVSLFNMLFCGALAQKESFASSLKWIFRLAPMSYAYEGMMINEMVGLIYNLGYNLAGGSHLRLPPQDGVVLLLQQGLCADYREVAPGGDAAQSCAIDARTDVVGVWATPFVAVAVAAMLLVFVVKYRR